MCVMGLASEAETRTSCWYHGVLPGWGILESETPDDDLSVAKDWSNGRAEASTSIGRADDQGDVEPPCVAQPTVGPSAKDDEAAALCIVHPRCILPAGIGKLESAITGHQLLMPSELDSAHNLMLVGPILG